MAAADAVTEQYAAAMDEAIAAATKAEQERDAARAEVARLQQELALWKGPVTVPTTEDCWRLFSTQDHRVLVPCARAPHADPLHWHC